MGTNANTVLGRVLYLEAEVNRRLVEREDDTHALLVAMLKRGGGNGLLLGPAGVGKSLLVRLLCAGVQGGRYAEVLMSPDMLAADLFGYPDEASALKGIYKVALQGSLEWATHAFLDEVYKAGGGHCQNRILQHMADRKVRVQGNVIDCPEAFLVAGASNELPEDKAALDAFDDRWDVRRWVDDIRSDDAFTGLVEAYAAGTTTTPIIDGPTVADLVTARDEAATVAVGHDIAELLRDCRRALADGAGLRASPRKWMRFTDVLKCEAWLAGRDAVEPEDVARLCGDVLWREPQERQPIVAIIGKLADPTGAKATEMLDAATAAFNEVRDLDPTADPDNWVAKAAKTNKGLRDQKAKLAELAKQYPGHAGIASALSRMAQYHDTLSRRLIEAAGAPARG